MKYELSLFLWVASIKHPQKWSIANGWRLHSPWQSLLIMQLKRVRPLCRIASFHCRSIICKIWSLSLVHCWFSKKGGRIRSLVVSVSWINPNLFLFPFNASQRGKVVPLVFIWVMSHGPRRAVGVIVSLFTRCLACHSATCLFGKISLWVGLLKSCHWERRDHLAARRKIRELEQNGCISCVSAHIVSQLFSPRRERTTTGQLTRIFNIALFDKPCQWQSLCQHWLLMWRPLLNHQEVLESSQTTC